MEHIGKEIPADAEPIIQFCFYLFILSLICIGCFVNITGYFLSLYLINKYNIENKYPKYAKIIRYYEKSKKYFLYLEIIICLICLLTINLCSLYVIANFVIW